MECINKEMCKEKLLYLLKYESTSSIHTYELECKVSLLILTVCSVNLTKMSLHLCLCWYDRKMAAT